MVGDTSISQLIVSNLIIYAQPPQDRIAFLSTESLFLLPLVALEGLADPFTDQTTLFFHFV